MSKAIKRTVYLGSQFQKNKNPFWLGVMAAGRHGGRNRKLRAHFLNRQKEAERANSEMA